MANTDLAIPLTAKAIGPVQGPGLSGFRTRPKVYYVQSQDLLSINAGATSGSNVFDDTVLKLKSSPNRVRIYESVSDFLAAQALAQGATASIQFASKYVAVTASGSTFGSAIAIDPTKYIVEVNAGNGLGVSLPDPFLRKVVVIYNTTTASVNVFPNRTGTGVTFAPIDGSTATYVLPAGKRRHFSAPVIPTTAGTTAGWQTAT